MNYPSDWEEVTPRNAHRLWKAADGITYDVWLVTLGDEKEPMMLTFVDTWGTRREVRRKVPPGTTLPELSDAELQIFLNEGRDWE